MNQCIIWLQKIRQARKCTYNANEQKSRQVNKQTIAQDECHSMPKMQKHNSKKKLHHLFGDCNVNKSSINTGQKHKSNEKHSSKGKAHISANNALKITQFAHVTPKQTWSTGSCTQVTKLKFPLQLFKFKKYTIWLVKLRVRFHESTHDERWGGSKSRLRMPVQYLILHISVKKTKKKIY